MMLASPNNQHYKALQPQATHFRRATCLEVSCPPYLLGWQTLIDEKTGFGLQQSTYIRRESKRQFSEAKQPDGLTAFVFPPGQRCFRGHQVSLDRPAIFLKETLGSRRRLEGQQWIDDMQEGLYRIGQRVQDG